MDIIKAHATNNLCYITGTKMTPKGIVVHSTGANNPTLKRYVDCPHEVGANLYNNHWNQAKPGGREVCVHAFIGYDKNNNIRVAEILPLDICCWGVGSGRNGSYNFDPAYIQLEICEDNMKNADYYKKVFDVSIKYSAYLCDKFNIPVENIVGHCEAYRLGYGCNHSDPEHWMKLFGETMDNYRSAVSWTLKNNKYQFEIKKDGEMDKSKDPISSGDLVAIFSNATYYDGQDIPSWVKRQNWYVKGDPIGDRVIIDKNEKMTTSICSPIKKDFLAVVKKADFLIDNSIHLPYLIRPTIDALSIYSGPGTNNTRVDSISQDGVYTVIEEQTGKGATLWGKLKSGVGWVSLEHTKRIK